LTCGSVENEVVCSAGFGVGVEDQVDAAGFLAYCESASQSSCVISALK
jgi:hypothetical protein